MRKTLLALMTSCAVVAFAPATALADHHARVHHRTFGSDEAPSTSPAQDENMGTVQSFKGGVLTILLTDQSTVRGKVTDATEIECEAAEPAEMRPNAEGDNGGGDHGDNNQGQDDRGQGDDQGDNRGNDQGEAQGEDQGDDQGEDRGDDNQAHMCGRADLTRGTVVSEATLATSRAGAVWDKIELVTQASEPSDRSEPSDSPEPSDSSEPSDS